MNIPSLVSVKEAAVNFVYIATNLSFRLNTDLSVASLKKSKRSLACCLV